MAIAQIEVTDTFGGEANYCWVKRWTMKLPPTLSDLAVVRRVKKQIGWTGLRCATDNFGDMIKITPHGQAQTCFITWEH